MKGDAAMDEALYRRYLAALIKGDRPTCRSIVTDLLEKDVEVKTIYTDLFQHSLYEVGDLWERHKISVATEHLATAITESLLTLVYPRIFSLEHTGKSALISCVANEFHQIGGRMVADIFELNGWHGYFLGSNTPITALLSMIGEKKPDIVGLSLAVHFNMPSLLEVIKKIRESFPALSLMVGGQAFRWGGIEVVTRYERVSYIASLHDLETLIRRYS
ncbi:MAG: cobalamin-dependent protein [Candidatus Eremiobacteraeota bacterium]|nr:cobalamin-dependent protein [Candidatus Eremiobacteraeota bacterium]